MLSINHLFLLLTLYIIMLFLIAQWAQSSSKRANKVRNSANTYALSLAVFCTSWTFFGNISLSSQQGIYPVSLYLGSTIAFIFMMPLLKKMVLLKNEFHSTSIADFISVRYHRSQSLAALISILCLLGITPYLTIQLKSVISSVNVLVPQLHSNSVFIEYFDVFVVLIMAFFTIIFGVRHLDPTEKHPGMMVALAFESIFKLIALLVGAFSIIYIFNGGVTSLFEKVAALESIQTTISPLSSQNWIGLMVLGALGMFTLPRQFHVGIVECDDIAVLDRAKWLFPLYLLLINIFALPIALAGLLNPELLASRDLLLLTLPLSQNASGVAIIVFLGGFAAATGMIMISAMTLSTMLTNHILVPIIISNPLLAPLKHHILKLRWLMVLSVLFLSLFYYRAIGDSQLIIKIGIISFIACAQFAPALIGGLIWPRGNLAGAISGLSVGAIIWFYSSLLPSVLRSGWLDWPILEQSSGFFYWFNPEHFFAIQQITPLANSLIWSLLINTLLYVGISLATSMSDEERKIAHQFVDIDNLHHNLPNNQNDPAVIHAETKVALIRDLFTQYMPISVVENKLELCLIKTEIINKEKITIIELSSLKNNSLNALAGVIGMASAFQAFEQIALIDEQEQQQLASYFSRFFAQLQLSPNEMFAQVNFHQQKRELLENHAKQQLSTISKLEEEVKQRLKAEMTANTLNEELELRVNERTQALRQSNHDLNQTLTELKQTQTKLLENEKMASLGGLVAGVAHEVNTPIGIVLTSISFMKEKCNDIIHAIEEQQLTSNQLDKFTQELTQGFDISLTNIERAVKLIESFKLIAIDSTIDEAREINLRTYLQDILASLAPKIKRTNINFTLDCPTNITIFSYPGAIAQITNNLVINSIIHAFDAQETGTITIKASQQGNKVTLVYSDDGKPLNKESTERIFEPFYTTKRGEGGSGLGAHIVYNLVTQRLKGNVELLTDQVKGKAFKIELPSDSRALS